MDSFPIVMTALAVAEVIAGLPLMFRRVKPNPFYGLHLSATHADQWVWYEANAKTGRDLALLGLLQLATLYLLPNMPAGAHLLINIAVAFVGAIVVALVGGFRAQSLLRKRRREQLAEG